MEILATKIAELMDITVESAIKLLPIIQHEYTWYKLGELLRRSIGICVVLAVAVFIIGVEIEDFAGYDYEEKEKHFRKCCKISGILWIIGYLLQLFMSPTTMMIKDFIIQ